MRQVRRVVAASFAGWALICFAAADAAEPTADSAVRAVVPRAATRVVVDGKLGADEYRGALVAPVEYFHPDRANRPGQFHFLWDEDAFYVGLRTLDQHAFSPEEPLWTGDAVEFYFDARRDANFLSRAWPTEPSPGAVHCFYTAMRREKLEPRFTLRPGFEQAIAKKGVEVAAERTATGLEVEFKMPWANFPGFVARAGEVVGLDAELSYSDGAERSDRSFAFGNPLSVWQPANLARVRLVEKLTRDDWASAAPVLMPMRVDVPWTQEGVAEAVGQIALPPGRREEIGEIAFKVFDLHGAQLGEYPATKETVLDAAGDFALREARWPVSIAPAGRYVALAVVRDREAREMARVAPRLVSVNSAQGY